MKRTLIITVLGLALTAGVANADLIAYWHFNDVTEAGALDQIDGLGTSAAKTAYTMDDGTGSGAVISAWDDGSAPVGTLVGTNGGAASNNFGADAGTTVNATNGTPAGSGLQVAGSDNNGASIIIKLDDALWNCVLSYASSRTTNGHATQTIDYSTDGGSNWENWGIINPQVGTTTPSWGTATVNLGDVLDNTSGANMIRITLAQVGGQFPDYASTWFDNIQVKGDSVPEPMTMAFLALGSVCLLVTGKTRRIRGR
ncbi:MAG: hypothetical protein GXY44_07700 [Phycisphaerales bacterium]|nr:hypothetical protein [Phycisphaerales bacterium]